LLLLSHVNHAATPFAQLLEEFIPANPVARLFCNQSCRANTHRILQEVRVTILSLGLKQRKNLLLELCVVTASLSEKSFPLSAGWLCLRLVEQFDEFVCRCHNHFRKAHDAFLPLCGIDA
jgi:hypothetical protein